MCERTGMSAHAMSGEASDAYRPLLPGIGFSGYRSFATWQTVLFPTKVTVLAGINNSGKSNILRFLQHIGPRLQNGRNGAPKLAGIDVPRGFAASATFEVGMPSRVGDTPPLDPGIQPIAAYHERLRGMLADVDGIFWTRFHVANGNLTPAPELIDEAISLWPGWRAQDYRRALSALGGGTIDPRDVMTRLLAGLNRFSDFPNTVTISSARRVESAEDGDPDWLSGRGIISALSALQNPRDDQWETARPRWASINRFVQTVLGDPDASLNIPHDFSTIQVETPQRVLPLASLGSGVEQVIVLAAAATVTMKSLVCLEEPETNLHPLLQKKLVRYLTDYTDNQYVIATHSAHLLDDARSTAHHVRLTIKGSEVHVARKPHELVGICNDLGYRPSDILQANCVIWVEGPSDRIYIRRWIALVDDALSEGIDYTIMFYGGKLLSHLTVNEGALDDFVELRHLNRASAVVIDSDKTSAHQRISATKKRIRDEFDASTFAPGFAWITKCYTIENYLPGDVLKAAVETVHGAEYDPVGQWVNPLPKRERGLYDKVGIARVAAELLRHEHLDVFDLRGRIEKLTSFIHSANGNSTAPAAVE